MGTVLQVPFAPQPWLDEGIFLLRQAGFRIVALTPAGELTLREVAPGGTAPGGTARGESAPRAGVAIMVGSEGPGLTQDALRAADVRVRIPMAGGVDSLNVATAAAIAFAALCG
jgi:tRNA G18 (ribose-2'-O)-methylase SpoU